MKKTLLFLAFLLGIALQTWAYTFSAVAPSGQTLYYNIVGGNAQVTYETQNNDVFFNYAQPAYTNLTGSLTIPSSVTYNGTTYSVTSIGTTAFERCRGLTSVTIPNSVTSISDTAFFGCIGMTSVTIPNSVTSIGAFAFSGCTGLTSVIIPNSVTSIGAYAFSFCTGLTSVIIPNSVTSISEAAFAYCDNLASIVVENGNTVYDNRDNCNAIIETATNTLIAGCKNTTIPNSVTSIGDFAFYGCSGLTSVIIPNSVTSIGIVAFYDCTGLTEIHSLNIVAPILDIYYSNYDGQSYYVFDHVSRSIPVYIPCGSSASYNSRWSCFYNFIENDSLSFSAASSDEQMGTVQILTIPTCPNPQAEVYASPNSGYHFDHWSDNSTSNPYTFTATEGTELIAYFALGTYYTVTAESADPSMGSVTGGGSYASGTTATLTASPYSGYHFSHWQDNVTSNPRTINVTGDATYTAYFESDGGGEQPSDNAPSIACVGVDMNGHNVVRWEPRQGVSVLRYNIYREGLGGYSQVGYVNTTNATEYSWVDDNSNTATQAYSYKISEVSANGTESDLSLPHTTMHLQISQGQGTTWNLSWTPYVGFNYSGYRIFRGTSSASMSLLTELSSSATTYSDNNAPSGNVYYQIEVVASSAKSITASSRSNIATSVQNQQFTITVLSDNTLMGTVSGGGTFAQGATTTITATPLSGYTFSQWSDGSTQAQRTITVTGNATYTAYFTAGGSEPQQYLITVVSNNPERGTVTGGGLYDAGAMITITAEPFAGYEFVQWHDGNTNDFRTITVTADATYTAYFRTATEGINDVETADNIKIYTRDNRIVIDFSGQTAADGRQSVVVYDVMGRVIKQTADSGQQAVVEIPVTSAGVYMVKVGEWPSRKVLVRQ